MPWSNEDLVLFHGCTDQSLRPQNPRGIAVGGLPHGIDHTIGARRPDFGPGFYATTWLQQAMNWANIRVRKISRHHPSAKAIVLRFAMKRNDLAELEDLIFINEKIGYYPFIGYCRSGGLPHAPTTARAKPYDVVYGPVSVIGQSHVIKDSDQISFHTARATSKIPAATVEAIGSPLFQVAP